MFQFKSTIAFTGRARGQRVGGTAVGGKKLRGLSKKTAKEIVDYVETPKKSFVGGGKLMDELGKRVILSLRERTRQGRDVDNRSFQDYTPPYKKFKSAIGLYTGNVNMSLSNNLLRSITYKRRTPFKGVVFVPSTKHPHAKTGMDELALIHMLGKGRQPRRVFFGWRKDSREDIALRRYARQIAMNEMRKRLKGNMR